MTSPDLPPPDVMALRVAAAKRNLEQAKGDYETLQAEAHAVFAEVRRRGQPSQEVRLPSGEAVCLISIETGGAVTRWQEPELLGVIATNEPDGFELHALPSAFTDREVLAVLAERFPQYVSTRVCRDVDQRYRAEAMENGGKVFLRAGALAGEQVTVATTEHLPAAGKYSVRWKPKGMDRLGDAIDAGQVSRWGDILVPPSDSYDADGLPQPAGILRADAPRAVPEAVAIAADPSFGEPGDRLFFDADGRFRSPELAALHACEVQGGFSTPARECRRMLADHKRAGTEDGEHAAMLRHWLAVKGIDADGEIEPNSGSAA